MQYTAQIKVNPETLKSINNYLAMTGKEIYDKYGIKRDEVIAYTGIFENGYQADIKIVICEWDEHPYIDAVLFDEKGNEISCDTPDDDTYDGKYFFWIGADDEYIVVIEPDIYS